MRTYQNFRKSFIQFGVFGHWLSGPTAYARLSHMVIFLLWFVEIALCWRCDKHR